MPQHATRIKHKGWSDLDHASQAGRAYRPRPASPAELADEVERWTCSRSDIRFTAIACYGIDPGDDTRKEYQHGGRARRAGKAEADLEGQRRSSSRGIKYSKFTENAFHVLLIVIIKKWQY